MPYVWRISAKTGLAVQSGSANRLSGRASASGVKDGWIVASEVQKATPCSHSFDDCSAHSRVVGFCSQLAGSNIPAAALLPSFACPSAYSSIICCARPMTLVQCWLSSEEHTSELQSLMRIQYAVFCLTKNI